VTGITISFGGNGNVITENNIINSSVFVMKQSPDNTVDRNYWSDYLTRYPNATEIGESGVWDTPYEGHEAFTDNHPLVEPVALNPESPDEEPFPTATIAAVSGVSTAVVVGAGLLVYFKKRKH
jgi:nitrous oxidase accessory protein NosD